MFAPMVPWARNPTLFKGFSKGGTMAEQQVYRIINQEREEEQRSGALLAT